MNLESIPIQAFLIVSSALFCIGIWGLLNSRNAVRVLMSIEFPSYLRNGLVTIAEGDIQLMVVLL